MAKTTAISNVGQRRDVLDDPEWRSSLPRAAPCDLRVRIEALQRGAPLNADRVIVEVDGGRVTLRGRARSWVKNDVLVQAAWPARGVTSVDNRIVVEP